MIIIAIIISTILHECYLYQIVVAYNCGQSQMVMTKMVNYSRDDMFSSSSRSIHKQSLPQTISHQEDKVLLKNERSSEDTFFYSFYLQKNGKYLLVMKFVEVIHKLKGQRIFNFKIGDQLIYMIDIAAEVGYGKILHKWVEFEVSDEIIYINGTYPVLNGFYFKDSVGKFVFEKVKGMPKIQAIFLLKGNDAQSISDYDVEFLSEYLSYEQFKDKQTNLHIAQKYRIPPNVTYSILTAQEVVETQSVSIIIDKVLSIKMIVSIISVVMILYSQQAKFKLWNLFRKSKKQ